MHCDSFSVPEDFQYFFLDSPDTEKQLFVGMDRETGFFVIDDKNQEGIQTQKFVKKPLHGINNHPKIRHILEQNSSQNENGRQLYLSSTHQGTRNAQGHPQFHFVILERKMSPFEDNVGSVLAHFSINEHGVAQAQEVTQNPDHSSPALSSFDWNHWKENGGWEEIRGDTAWICHKLNQSQITDCLNKDFLGFYDFDCREEDDGSTYCQRSPFQDFAEVSKWVALLIGIILLFTFFASGQFRKLAEKIIDWCQNKQPFEPLQLFLLNQKRVRQEGDLLQRLMDVSSLPQFYFAETTHSDHPLYSEMMTWIRQVSTVSQQLYLSFLIDEGGSAVLPRGDFEKKLGDIFSRSLSPEEYFKTTLEFFPNEKRVILNQFSKLRQVLLLIQCQSDGVIDTTAFFPDIGVAFFDLFIPPGLEFFEKYANGVFTVKPPIRFSFLGQRLELEKRHSFFGSRYEYLFMLNEKRTWVERSQFFSVLSKEIRSSILSSLYDLLTIPFSIPVLGLLGFFEITDAHQYIANIISEYGNKSYYIDFTKESSPILLKLYYYCLILDGILEGDTVFSVEDFRINSMLDGESIYFFPNRFDGRDFYLKTKAGERCYSIKDNEKLLDKYIQKNEIIVIEYFGVSEKWGAKTHLNWGFGLEF